MEEEIREEISKEKLIEILFSSPTKQRINLVAAIQTPELFRTILLYRFLGMMGVREAKMFGDLLLELSVSLGRLGRQDAIQLVSQAPEKVQVIGEEGEEK